MLTFTWVALAIVILTCIRRAFYNGSSLCYVSLINFSIILFIHYSHFLGDNYIVLCIARGALVSSVLLFSYRFDKENLPVIKQYWGMTAATVLFELLYLDGSISYNGYIIIGVISTIIEIFIINKRFTYVRGTGHFGIISGGYAFFSNWSRWMGSLSGLYTQATSKRIEGGS